MLQEQLTALASRASGQKDREGLENSRDRWLYCLFPGPACCLVAGAGTSSSAARHMECLPVHKSVLRSASPSYWWPRVTVWLPGSTSAQGDGSKPGAKRTHGQAAPTAAHSRQLTEEHCTAHVGLTQSIGGILQRYDIQLLALSGTDHTHCTRSHATKCVERAGRPLHCCVPAPHFRKCPVSTIETHWHTCVAFNRGLTL